MSNPDREWKPWGDHPFYIVFSCVFAVIGSAIPLYFYFSERPRTPSVAEARATLNRILSGAGANFRHPFVYRPEVGGGGGYETSALQVFDTIRAC